ncbi:MAG: helix-turn-helix domain-containing protein [Planctomycetes bacterium]|nr:helix-turn-helix domain-containing protein [Planctomycetota bacterium]
MEHRTTSQDLRPLREITIPFVDPATLQELVSSAVERHLHAMEERLVSRLRRREETNSPNPLSELLSEREIAGLLHCHPRTVRRLELAKTLPRSIRIGSAKRWRSEEIKQWLAGVQTTEFRRTTISKS